MSNQDRLQHDVLIIGGGPSGLSTALHLAQIAPHLTGRILILEKAHYPRPKLCAGGLTADAEIILQRLGLDVSEVPHVDASAAHLDFAGKGLTISLPNTHALRIIRRNEFDAWLAQKVKDKGIEIREEITVKNIQPQDDCVIVETDAGSFTAQIVVGADGSNGITRRCILPNESIHTARVLEVITPTHPPHPHRPSDTSPNSPNLGKDGKGLPTLISSPFHWALPVIHGISPHRSMASPCGAGASTTRIFYRIKSAPRSRDL